MDAVSVRLLFKFGCRATEHGVSVKSEHSRNELHPFKPVQRFASPSPLCLSIALQTHSPHAASAVSSSGFSSARPSISTARYAPAPSVVISMVNLPTANRTLKTGSGFPSASFSGGNLIDGVFGLLIYRSLFRSGRRGRLCLWFVSWSPSRCVGGAFVRI